MNQVVAWITNGSLYGLRRTEKKTAVVHRERTKVARIPVFIEQPASKPWVGLTQQDIDIAFDDTQEGGGFDDFARAIEAKLKEKNT